MKFAKIFSLPFQVLFILFTFTPGYALSQADFDADGLPDQWESDFGFDPNFPGDANSDPDEDGADNLAEYRAASHPRRYDSDADGAADGHDEYPLNRLYIRDSDGDGLPDAEELLSGYSPYEATDATIDFDGDGLDRLQEFQQGTNDTKQDTDRDGLDDGADKWPLDRRYRTDTDNDGLPDAYENKFSFLDMYFSQDADFDFDFDGLTNLEEFILGTSSDNVDSDYDGQPDISDIAPTNPAYARDEDEDGLPDEWELLNGLSPWIRSTYDDPDYDQLSNIDEYQRSLDPNRYDSDFDGVNDGDDHFPSDHRYYIDQDRDNMPYSYERQYGLSDSIIEDGASDYDRDGLSNRDEFLIGTDLDLNDTDFDRVYDGDDLWPLDRTRALDSDGDGIYDAYEIIHGFNPHDPFDAEYDQDGDGLNRLAEFRLGTSDKKRDSDGDGVDDDVDQYPSNPLYKQDRDEDGLPDAYERRFRFLRHYRPDDAALDFDGDTLSNLAEFTLGTAPDQHDSDRDGFSDEDDAFPRNPNYQLDSDGDGMPDAFEQEYNGYPDGYPDDYPQPHTSLDPYQPDGHLDLDGDDLTNLQEFLLGTRVDHPASDSDRWPDGQEHFPLDPLFSFDSDRDGMPDEYEVRYGLDPYFTEDGGYDMDHDGLNNAQEYAAGSNPANPDSDLDGVPDSDDMWPMDRTRALDSDSDGIYDAYEIIHGFNPHDPIDAEYDQDGDGLNRLAEFHLGTSDKKRDSDSDGVYDDVDQYPSNPLYNLDSDEDGLPDAYENRFPFLSATDPSDAVFDFDGDTLSNLAEFTLGTAPDQHDSDHDGFSDEDDAFPLNSLYHLDSDSDGMPDAFEHEYNGHPDGYPDYDPQPHLSLDPYRPDGHLDLDRDDLTNLQEFLLGTRVDHPDSDNDDWPDGHEHFPLDPLFSLDSDRDSMPDEYEVRYGLDPYFTEDGGHDMDHDGLNNAQEYALNTFPDLPDSDFDGIPDGEDLWPRDPSRALDSNHDGISDADEIAGGRDPMALRPRAQDNDGDGLTYREEALLGSSDENEDSDHDGVIDSLDAFPLLSLYTSDSDNDGLPDAYEISITLTSPTDATDNQIDRDEDGLGALEEFILGSDPRSSDSDGDGTPDGIDPAPLSPRYVIDSDGDGLPDSWEIENGLDPFTADAHHDLDGDRRTNIEEYRAGSSARDIDSDGDGANDLEDRFPLNPLFSRDYDRDGMPTEWEIENGLSDSDAFDRNSDEDADGYTNYQEYASQTDPRFADRPFTAAYVRTISHGDASGYALGDQYNQHTLIAEGQGFGQWVDNISFAYVEFSGDVDLRVRVSSIEQNWTSGGIALRASLDSGSPSIANVIDMEAGAVTHKRIFEYTPSPSITHANASSGSWLRLTKRGDQVTSYVSNDGSSWGKVESVHIELGQRFFVGLAGTTNELSLTNTIAYDSLSLYSR